MLRRLELEEAEMVPRRDMEICGQQFLSMMKLLWYIDDNYHQVGLTRDIDVIRSLISPRFINITQTVNRHIICWRYHTVLRR